MNFQTIQEFYQLQLWNAAQIAELVAGGVITAEQYKEIVGENYNTSATSQTQNGAIG